MSRVTGLALITGSAGMVGSHLAHALADSGTPVLASYYRPTVSLAELPGAPHRRVELDMCHMEVVRRLLEAERPAEIYHLAAQSLPTVSWDNPWDTMQTNVGGTVNLFEAIKAVRATDPGYDPVIVVACSSAAYGATLRPENVPIREDSVLQPMSPYGVSKAAQDMLTWQYHLNDGIRGVRARMFNTTGPRKTRDVVSDFAARVALIARDGGRLRVGNLETQRAILDVRDLVAALMLLARRGEAGEAYNVCAERAHRIGDLLPMFADAAGVALEVEADPALFRPSDEAIIFGDTSRLRARTGWSQTVPIDQTIRAVVAHEMAVLARS